MPAQQRQPQNQSRKRNPSERQTGYTYRNELGLPRRTPCQDNSVNRKANAESETRATDKPGKNWADRGSTNRKTKAESETRAKDEPGTHTEMNWAYPAGPPARTAAPTAKQKPNAKPERQTNRENLQTSTGLPRRTHCQDNSANRMSKAKPESKTNRGRAGPTEAAPTAEPTPKAKPERKTNRENIQK